MHHQLAALARKHDIAAPLLADLEALLAEHARAAGGPIGDHPRVELEPPERSTGTDRAPGGAAGLGPPLVPRVADRYEDLGPLASGGMGEVRRVRDLHLNRVLAMKTLHLGLAKRPEAVVRFLEEAQATAQLQHPGVVPVHDIGVLPDGRAWFTMRVIRGRTLRDVLKEVHDASPDQWAPAPSGWTFRRLVASFLQVCHAVAYAHERGVVHRDLKPDNVMVGTHGETYVLDWGLAKIVGRPDQPLGATEGGDEGTVAGLRSDDVGTRVGAVMGTPAYMAPEQARGEVDAIDPRTDVYALGAVLYELLSGRPPYEGPARAALAQVLRGPPVAVGRIASMVTLGFGNTLDEPPTSLSGPPLPEELVSACERAMARSPAGRFPTARALADEIQSWLDGSRRREQALEVTARAVAVGDQARALVARASALREEAKALLEEVAPWEPEERKAPGWAKAADAEAAERAAELKELEVDQTLVAALQVSPGLPEAHAALAERVWARHVAAAATRDRADQAKAETLLTAHAAALPESHPVRREVATYLKGDGALTLVTDPPGGEVSLFRYHERNRRMVEVYERELGRTPLRAVPLPMGSYLCVVRHPDRAEVRYPAEVTRCGHWDGVAPGEREPHPVWLPPRGYLGADEVYVPAGWFRAGGDPTVGSFPPQRIWCDALVMQRFPVTNAAYVAFLEDLVTRGREDEALRHVPRERASTEGELGALIYAYEGGRFYLRPDAEGDVWLPDCPVLHVDWYGARATSRGWRSGRGARGACRRSWSGRRRRGAWTGGGTRGATSWTRPGAGISTPPAVASTGTTGRPWWTPTRWTRARAGCAGWEETSRTGVSTFTTRRPPSSTTVSLLQTRRRTPRPTRSGSSGAARGAPAPGTRARRTGTASRPRTEARSTGSEGCSARSRSASTLAIGPCTEATPPRSRR